MNNKISILVTKASGDKVPFVEDKLRNSMVRSGANQKQIHNLITEVYEALPFTVVHVPVLPIEERVDYILEHL